MSRPLRGAALLALAFVPVLTWADAPPDRILAVVREPAGPAPDGVSDALEDGLSHVLAETPAAKGAATLPTGAAPSAANRTIRFLAGGAFGLVAHETGHLFFDVAFDADPGVKGVKGAGIPFFAITHRPGLPRRQEFVIASAGFWVQHAGSEWLLSRRPNLRRERAPFAKGLLAFNVLTSAMYSGAAFASTGPVERDTRGIADSLRIAEPWVGVMLIVPAGLDVYRYYHPETRWAAWASRLVKVGLVLLVVK